MKLRTRLFLRIIIILLIQVSLNLGIVLVNFTYHVRTSSQESLLTAWHDARMSFEQLKHEFYLSIYFVNSIVASLSPEKLAVGTDNLLRQYYNSSMIDIIAIKNDTGKLLYILQEKGNPYLQIINLLNDSQFRFAHNRYLIMHMPSGSPILYLVTGISQSRNKTSYLYIYLIKHLDNQFLNAVFQKTGLNIGLFYGSEYLTSNLPAVEYLKPDEGEFSMQVGQNPYWGYAAPIAYLDNVPLKLIVLKSIIRDQIYINDILINFSLIFVASLFFSFLVAFGMTAQLVSPLAKLNNWMLAYFKTKAIPPLSIYPKDEIGFLAESFHNMVVRIIKEEQIIKSQLKEITFLNRYNELVMNNLQAGVLIVSANATIEYANPYIAALLQADVSSLEGQDITDLLKQSFKVPMWESPHFHLDLSKPHHLVDICLKGPQAEHIKFVLKIIPLENQEACGRCLIVLEDITKTEHLWQKILVSEKIATLGIITAGLAHEINNPLSSILSHVQFLETIETEKEKLDSISWIKSEAVRIAKLINQVLDFARRDSKQISEINYTLKEIINLFSSSFQRSNIEVKLKLEAKPLYVQIDADSLKQALINIIMNAQQAMPEGGLLKVGTSQKAKDLARIRIQDSGVGIDPQNLKNIFTPFFTTKQNGQGVGLGLCITYSIIERAGGEIAIKSQKNKGTKVDILLHRIKDME